MVVSDAFNYILFKNPIVTYSLGTIKHLGAGVVGVMGKSETKPSLLLDDKTISNIFRVNRSFLRLIGVCGASAVIIGAYGAHTLLAGEGNDHRKKVFQTASQYHFYHILGLMSAPFCRYPKLTALTIAGGIIIFCGSCYYQSLTGDEKYRRITPYGGSLLIIGWLSMLL